MGLIAGLISFVLLIFGALLLSVVFAIPAGLFVMLTWNAVIPYAFGLPSIDWLQGISLALLASILFKSSNVSTSK